MSKFKIYADFNGTIIKKNGETLSWDKKNLVVNAGFEFIAHALFNTSATRGARMAYIALGSSSVPTTASMTSLQQEFLRVPAVVIWDSLNKQVTLTAEIPNTISVEVGEAGIFNASSGGTMFDRVSFSSKGMDPGEIFVPNFKVNIF